MDELETPTSSDLLQVTVTIAGIAVALAALTLDRGPAIRGARVLPIVLLFAGLPSVVGAVYAVAEMRWEAGLGWRDLLRISRRRGEWADAPYTREAILSAAWSLYLLAVAYAAIFVAAGF